MSQEDFDGDKEMARELLQERWEGMRDSANEGQQNISLGYLLAFFHMGHVTEVEAEGWQERFKRCPGHEPSRKWCAYCGDVEPDVEEFPA